MVLRRTENAVSVNKNLAIARFFRRRQAVGLGALRRPKYNTMTTLSDCKDL